MFTLFGLGGRLLPDVRPFLDAIRKEPEEDLHRLVLADLLQERGDAERGDADHAALIRLQCARARAEPYLPIPPWRCLGEEERRLLLGDGLPRTIWPGLAPVDYDRFARGLPTAIRVSAPSRLKGTRSALTVGTVDTLIVERVRSARELARHLRTHRFARLSLGINPGELAALLAEADVSGVSGWALRRRAGDSDLVALRDAVRDGEATVEELDVSGVEYHHLLAELLSDLARGMRAGVLDVSCQAEARWVIQNLTAPPFTAGCGVRRLVAENAGLGDDELSAIAGWPGASVLEYLSVGDNEGGFGDAGAEALAGSPYLSALRVLLLCGCGVTDRGALALAGVPTGWDLRWIDLRGTRVTPAGVAALRDRFPGCRIDAPNGIAS